MRMNSPLAAATAAFVVASMAAAPAMANYLPWKRPLHLERTCKLVKKCPKAGRFHRGCKTLRICRPADRRKY